MIIVPTLLFVLYFAWRGSIRAIGAMKKGDGVVLRGSIEIEKRLRDEERRVFALEQVALLKTLSFLFCPFF